MDLVFVDTSFWMAQIVPDDPWTAVAQKAVGELGTVHLITSDYVLVELLNGLSNCGEILRRRGVLAIQRTVANPGITTVEGSRAFFDEALRLYEQRADKRYSLTDCTSMVKMRERGIRKVLTSDHHFEQEGFTILMKRR